MRAEFKIMAAAVLILQALGAKAEGQMPINPIRDTSPFVESDRNKVLVFFSYKCPVCRNYHLSLSNWGKSLPKGIRLEFYPVVEPGTSGPGISAESANASMTFWTVEKIGSMKQREEFSEVGYELVQDKHQEKPEAWVRTALNTGINVKNFKSGLKVVQEEWDNRVATQVHYQPNSTPSMVVCGKWMITPDSTNGDFQLFFQLANGLVSRCMGDKGMAKY